jgi:hypothetical protein
MSSLGIFNPPSKMAHPLDRRTRGLGDLSPTPKYTWKSGDTGISVAKHFVDNGNRWTELAAENPKHKCASYGFCANPGNVVTLPPSWVAAAPAAASSSTSATTAVQIPSAPPAEAVTNAIAPSAPSVADQLAPTKAGMSTGMKIGIAAGAVALVGLAVYAKSSKKKAA